jgi:hypothetical protein
MQTVVKAVVAMNGEGWLRLPAEVRAAIGAGGDMTFQVEAAGGIVVLQPDPEIPPEDAWAYTPEHLARVELARCQEGRPMSENEILRLIEDANR